MRKVILAAVILQLALTLTNQYKFGDLISFKRRCRTRGITYKHFAIYVGNGPDVGQNGHDIFHRTKDRGLHPPRLTNCIFGDLKSEERQPNTIDQRLDNYLDGIEGFEVGSDQEMAARIKAKHNNCGFYSLTCNNCEHLATYVRYNRRLSLQMNATAESLLGLVNRGVRARIADMVREIREGVRAEHECGAANQSG